MTPANETGAPLPEESDSASAASGVSPVSDTSPGGGAAAAASPAASPSSPSSPSSSPADPGAAEGEHGADAAEAADVVGDGEIGSDAAAPALDAESEPDPEAVRRAAAEAEAEAAAARERAVFDELVASFHTETAPDPVPRKIIRHPVLNVEPVWEQPDVEPDDPTVDKYFPSEHFEPPEPPPLPDTSGATKASWTLLIGGVLFLVLRTLLQWNTEEWTFWLAVAAVFGGIVSLVVRMQPDRDDYDDPDHGAVV